MGAKDSKPSFISYEDACRRISESELKRIEDAYKKCAGSAGTALSKAVFVQEVLGEGVPADVCEWLYTTCGGTRRGIAYKDLVRGLVLLTKGTTDEKIRFLWTLYSNDSGLHINKWDFIKALQAENASLHPPGVRPLCIASSESLSALFGKNSEKADFDQFAVWMSQRKGATVLSRWMLLDQRVTLTSDLETPTFYQTLAGVTHLEEKDISTLEKCFWALQSRSASGQLDLEVVAPLLSPPLPRAALPGLFTALDENRDGHIDFKELCCGLSAACRGPDCERIKFCFKVFDVDRDGLLDPKELQHMCQVLAFVSNQSQPERISHHPDAVYKSLRELAAREDNQTVEHASSEKSRCLTEKKWRAAVGTRDVEEQWGLSQQDFLIWSVEKASELISPMLTLINQVAHIVLGLRPTCRHHERDIVLGWLKREERRGYSVGQFWYLVSAEWWKSWLAYTGANTPCSCCGRRSLFQWHTSPLEEAVACDHSDTAGDGSSQSSSSSGVSSTTSRSSPCKPGPGPIINSQLLQQNPYKVRSLTGEGGYLRRDVTLSQHRDFELVPDSLWKALAQWYGGPQPLPRQVIHPPDSDIELELYPKTLRLYRHGPPGGLSAANPGQTQSSWSGMVGGYGAAALSSVGMSSYQSTPPPPNRYLAYTAAFSRLASVRQVCDFICAQLGLSREDVRLWTMSTESLGELLEEEDVTLDKLGLEEGHRLLLEVRNKDLTWPEEMGALSNLAASVGDGRRSLAGVSNSASASAHPAGATGLHNLGNTCFMNAALQAVWNTGPLTSYFTKNMHLYEVNKDNPHGTGGALALRYGELCRDVWCSGARSVAPLRVRWCISKHASRFSGGGQHDSQELLAWLLDALHEDLNRAPLPGSVPYVELRDSDGRPDQEVAEEAWQLHTERNRSIITELFYGQLKSKVTCSQCGHESVRFDAFNMLSLPLPMENYAVVEVTVVLLDGATPVRYGLCLTSESRYWHVKERTSHLSGVPTACMLLLLSGWPPQAPLDSHTISTSYCFIYQTPPPCGSAEPLSCGDKPASPAMAARGGGERNSLSNDHECSPTTTPSYLKTKNTAGVEEWHSGTTNYNNNNKEQSSVEGRDAVRWGSAEEGGRSVKNYLMAIHRKQSRQDNYFLSQHKRRWECFGIPVVVAIAEGCGGRQLYGAVWKQVERLLSAPPPQPPDQSNHATDCDDSLGYTFPFTLRVVGPKALRCAVCPWTNFCRGCALPCTDEPLISNLCSFSSSPIHCYPTGHHVVEESCGGGRESVVTLLDMSQLRDGEVFLAVDWEPTALHLRYQSNREKMVTEHESVGQCRASATAPVQLQHCLHAFTQEEKLDEMYACSACSRHQPATKKLQIWRLPPVLIIHLKRFQFVGRKWIKSHKAVNFPFQDFDPSAYLASVPQETILRHAEVGQHQTTPRERLVSTSLSRTPVLDDHFVDFHQHKLQQGENPLDLKYRLYAVVSHSGMLNGGHYVAYARNPCGTWYCYNDSSCREVSESTHPNLDPSAAYLLFYERLGLDVEAYLPDIRERSPCAERLTQLAEGEDSDLKKMCSIS